MNIDDVGQFILQVFAPFIPIVAGGVMSVILILLILVLFKRYLPKGFEP